MLFFQQNHISDEMKRIFLVEDEDNLREIIQLNLAFEGFDVKSVADGSEALRVLKQLSFDLAIIDVMLPFANGIDVCAEARQLHPEMPVLMISAKSDSKDRISGLKAGADDYLPKPFDLEELILRVNSLIRRSGKTTSVHESKKFKFGGFLVDLNAFSVFKHDELICSLNKKEASLLQILLENEGTVVSREQLLEYLWAEDTTPTGRTIDNYIVQFRKIFGDDSKNPQYFVSVRGVGYKFSGKLSN